MKIKMQLKLVYVTIFLIIAVSAGKREAKFQCDRGRLQLTAKTIKKLRKAFYRNAWPDDTFNRTLGSTALLNCNSFGFRGNVKKVPCIFGRWFKNGRPLFNNSRKIEIVGFNRRLSIKGTQLNITNMSYNDTGNYSCKLAVLNGSLNEIYVFQMNFTVNIERPKSGRQSPSISSSQDDENKDHIIFIVAGAVVGCFLAIAIITFFCKMKTHKACSVFNKREKSKSDIRASDVLFASTSSPETQLFSELCEEENKKLYEEPICQRFLRPLKEEPTYVNMERYKAFFPFINDVEWTMLKASEVDRHSVKCDVEHSMPIVLGTGNFGQVYRGELRHDDGSVSTVAVKRLNDSYKPTELGHFLAEGLTHLKAGHHCNVISLIGSVLLDTVEDIGVDRIMKKPPILLMELANEGNLKIYLQDRRLSPDVSAKHADQIMEMSKLTDAEQSIAIGKDLTLKDLASFSYQAARGMKHLASKNIVHRDLAARNVLLTSDRVIKIADFGLSKHIRNLQQEYYKIHRPAITPAKWTAPEALLENTFSAKSDVWSYGVLLWEMFSMGAQPYLGVPVEQLSKRLATGMRLDKPDFATTTTYSIMRRCWRWNRDERPGFGDLVRFFENSLLSVSEPYVKLGESLDSALTPTYKSDSELGSDSVFEYVETTSKKSCSTLSGDSACITTASTSSKCSFDDDLEAAMKDSDAMVFKELINPLYEC